MGCDEGEARWALVGLAALDPDPAVLDHVDAAPAVGADEGAEGVDEGDGAERLAVDARPARPSSKPITRSRGSVAVATVSSHTPCGRLGPRVLHLAALDRPTPEIVVDRVQLLLRLRGSGSRTGRRIRSPARGSAPLLAGAMTSMSGASARADTSKRTWSLPLPVHPWATASAPWRLRSGDEVLDDHRPRTATTRAGTALVERVRGERRTQYSSANSSRQSTTSASTAPAARARSGSCPSSRRRPYRPGRRRGERDDLDLELLLHPVDGDARVESSAVCEHDALCHGSPQSSSFGGSGVAPGQTGWRSVLAARTAARSWRRSARCRRRRRCRARLAGRCGRAPRRRRVRIPAASGRQRGWRSGRPGRPSRRAPAGGGPRAPSGPSAAPEPRRRARRPALGPSPRPSPRGRARRSPGWRAPRCPRAADELGLALTGGRRAAGDPVLALGLGHAAGFGPSADPPEEPDEQAPDGVHAVRRPAARPGSALPPAPLRSPPRRGGRAGSAGRSRRRAASVEELPVDGEPSNGASRRPASSSWPIDAQTSVLTTSASLTASPGRSTTSGSQARSGDERERLRWVVERGAPGLASRTRPPSLARRDPG